MTLGYCVKGPIREHTSVLSFSCFIHLIKLFYPIDGELSSLVGKPFHRIQCQKLQQKTRDTVVSSSLMSRDTEVSSSLMSSFLLEAQGEGRGENTEVGKKIIKRETLNNSTFTQTRFSKGRAQ